MNRFPTAESLNGKARQRPYSRPKVPSIAKQRRARTASIRGASPTGRPGRQPPSHRSPRPRRIPTGLFDCPVWPRWIPTHRTRAPEVYTWHQGSSSECQREPPPKNPVQDLISRTFAMSKSSSDTSASRTGTAAIRNASRPDAMVARSILSTAVSAISSELAHTANDRPDAASIRKKYPTPSGTPNRSSILSGCAYLPDPGASRAGSGGSSGRLPAASLKLGI